MSSRLERIEVFWGQLMAGYTHEMKNILATINESGGFIDDIYRLHKQNDPAYQKKIQISLDIIRQQVERGELLSSQLNALAHSPDQEIGSISLQDTVSVLVGLYERFARRKKVTLKLDAPSEGLSMTTNQVLMMHLVFVALEWTLSGFQSTGEILIRPRKGHSGYLLEIVCSGEHLSHDTAGEYWSLMHDLGDKLQTDLQWDASGSVLSLAFPVELFGPASR